MKVYALKKLLADVDEDLDILVGSADHGYYVVDSARVLAVEYNPNFGEYAEYHDEANLGPDCICTKGLVVG